MTTIEKTDDGYTILWDGIPALRVYGAAETEANWVDKAKRNEYRRTPLPREKWQCHFTGARFTPAQVAALAAALDGLAE